MNWGGRWPAAISEARKGELLAEVEPQLAQSTTSTTRAGLPFRRPRDTLEEADAAIAASCRIRTSQADIRRSPRLHWLGRRFNAVAAPQALTPSGRHLCGAGSAPALGLAGVDCMAGRGGSTG